MQQSTFAGSRWRHDRDHLSPPQTQVGIRQNADAFLAATIGFLKAARFENHGGVPRIVGGHASRELCVLSHSAAGLRASSRAAPATQIRCWCSNPRAMSGFALDVRPFTQTVSYFRPSLAYPKEGNFG